MKKVILILSLMMIGNLVWAECGCLKPQSECQQISKDYENGTKHTKCLDLITSMYNERATLYNVLNLSSDQQKCKDVIDAKRHDELTKQFQQYEQEKFVLDKMCKNKASSQALKKQENVVKNIEKCMKKIGDKYDKEFKSVLTSEQRSKLKSIKKMQKKEIKYCQKNKAFYKQDPNLRPFGEKMYKNNDEKLYPIHNKWHLFGFKHNSHPNSYNSHTH